ncbi:hypothetical protein CAPTEDRAFT_204149 [Capitella teleta]|uniref:XK-related protein n=1 Tax=Capitella teleta TaxID=283909 RepID=R7UCS2_CAPTE|nr:hypothetical protein CAPTEDRAFT_204149 [Capitella teleta]|eukprot:ELU01588.1 hypothetical protein CAPTEDRAFT_204149 [Capitella teleta]
MASPLDAGVAPELHDGQTDMLFKFHARPCVQCFYSVAFFVSTSLTLSDLITDVWLIVDYGLREHVAYLGVGLFSVLLAQFGAATMYAIQMRLDLQQQGDTSKTSMVRLYGCLLLNFPCHLGILMHRFHHNCNRHCQQCFDSSSQNQQQQETSPASREAEWKFAKIKLLQSLLQCGPQLGLNLLHMLRYSSQVSVLQCSSAVLSFLSLVIGVVQYEQCRSQSSLSALSTLCMLFYQVLLLGARVLAVSCFVFFFGAWAAAVLAPHLAIMLISLCYLHHFSAAWPPVPVYKLCLHSVYALLAYIPVCSEYRADGEMILCHVLLLLENVLMACLPYALEPSMAVPQSLLPLHSRTYDALCGLIVAGSVMGSVFFGLYSCFLDTPYSSLASSERPSCVCCWCCKGRDEDGAPQPPSSLDIHSIGGSRKRRHRRRRQLDSSYLSTHTGAGPPAPPQCYHTLDECGTPPELTDSPPPTVRLERDSASVQLLSPGSVLGIGGALVISPADEEAAGRPSIMEGEDDSEAEVINDSDKTPLKP